MERNADIVSNDKIRNNTETLEKHFKYAHKNTNYLKCVEKLRNEKINIDSLGKNEVKAIFENLIFSLEQN